ncbi:CBO0543 family protein [Ornithinibacillus contaminans]|uniref:CBO0543 family protein n=1 Tax=Ornithinibacillus contaminans TaxID=694055 RepID=UPI00064DE24B|nr:CBO0543 family protein [Ornithinibacillus contaminans]
MITKEQLSAEIAKLDTELMDSILDFWNQYGHFGTWQFWINVISFVLPLIITFLVIDRKKIFQIAFFGYTFHMILVYLDVFLTRNNYWDHPYHMIPYIPVSIPIDGVLVPVIFMLAYQFALNHKRNVYLVILITAIGATLIAWVWNQLGLLVLSNGMNILYIYLIQIIISVISYWWTNLFLSLRKRESIDEE